MSWSMNEAEALARKAARGAGMSWGLAEETGKATRALLEQGIDAGVLLAEWLGRMDGKDYARIAPLSGGIEWSASDGTLCPIASGAALSDNADAINAGAVITLQGTAYPVFLVPFMQTVAARGDGCVRLDWAGVTISATASAIHIDGDPAVLLVPHADIVTCAKADTVQGRALTPATRAEMTAETASLLSRFAHRTYAPATDASRLAGAGAGLSDND